MSDPQTLWETTTLGHLAGSGQYGWTTKAAREGRVRLLRTTDISRGHIDWNTVPFCSELPADSQEYALRPGDILISRAGSVGFSILLSDVPEDAVFASYLIRFVPTNAVVPRYLAHYLRSPDYWHQIAGAAAGIALANVNAKKLSAVSIPLAPFHEQKRIADKLDTLLARLGACRERLDRVPAILKRFRQSVLAAAMSGRLTEDWREANGSTSEWRQVKLSDVSSSRLGKMLDTAKNQGTPTPYLRNINVRWFRFELDNVQQIRVTPQEATELSLRSGDVLVCEGGEPGRCAIWREEASRYIYQKALHRVRVGPALTPEWLCYSLKDAADSGRLSDLFTGTTIKHLTGVALSRFTLALPAKGEQVEIARRVESLFVYADRLEARYAAARTRLERLTPVLLAKAFLGELVPQDPHDEPAAILLERIGAARAAAPAKSKRGKTERKTDMTQITRESVLDAIGQMPRDRFTFDELRSAVPADYEVLKEIVFDLLTDAKPGLKQYFDREAGAMRFVRLNP